jgi:hypothetical protein
MIVELKSASDNSPKNTSPNSGQDLVSDSETNEPQSKNNPTRSVDIPNIPKVKNIEKMIAEAYSHHLTIPDTEPFEIPSDYYETILKHFRDAKPDTNAWSGDSEIGTVRLLLEGGRSIRICWFESGHKARLSFSCGGIRYRSTGERFAEDENMALDAMIRKLCEEIRKDAKIEKEKSVTR